MKMYQNLILTNPDIHTRKHTSLLLTPHDGDGDQTYEDSSRMINLASTVFILSTGTL